MRDVKPSPTECDDPVASFERTTCTQGTSIHQMAKYSFRTIRDGRFDHTILFGGPRKGGVRGLSSFPIDTTKFQQELLREDDMHARDVGISRRGRSPGDRGGPVPVGADRGTVKSGGPGTVKPPLKPHWVESQLGGLT